MNKETYIKLTPREHVLKRPGMYIGSLTTELKEMYVVPDINNLKCVYKSVEYNPGFFKLFDEILTNASDHSIRTGKVKNINIIVSKDFISIENDGQGIPVEINKTEKMYNQELIFCHMMSGSNFDDTVERKFGGLNGLGSKLVNIYSKKFIVETADGNKKYTQESSENLKKVSKPIIKTSKKNYTKITFYPDFEKFGLTEITEEIEQILIKRALDISVYCPKVKVKYNNILLPTKSFKDYMKMHISDDSEIYYERINEDWEIGIARSIDDNFKQISMVNGLSTYAGGTHVNYIINQIIKGIKDDLEKKHRNITIRQGDIKSKLFLFLNCRLTNPVFDTQTKENLTLKLTPEMTTGVSVSDKLIKQLSQSSIVEDILNYILVKEQTELSKLGKGKVNKVKIKKLDDANFAGTDQSDRCMLFISEGDSGAGTVLTGFASTGRDYYGCMPIKGKISNVKKESISIIKENDEIKSIITALGLEFGKKYTNTKNLRYGKLVIMTDADCDGYHITGLLINLFETFWPELLYMDFLYQFVTPIVKIQKGKNIKFFYKLQDYNKWKELNETGFEITYYKGLGTILPDEIKEFFKNINKHLIKFNYKSKDDTREIIKLIFDKKRENDRKSWLLNYKPTKMIDKFTIPTTYESFFNTEYIEFSMYDNVRSIPNIIDGFKPSQRKILYTMFKNNYKSNIKVCNLAGAIIEKTSYHHAPQSLEGAIINLAQTFVGTNNINLLQPLGNFGSRLKGGEDAASSRYIFTSLNDITRFIFLDTDDNILEYLNDDGFPIEPKHYIPIIPTILINGAEGIGTGWSTFVPKFDPKDIAKYLTAKLQGKKEVKIHPHYKGFKGEIYFDSENNRYVTKGVITKANMSTLKVSELPIGLWNDKYYDTLDKLITNGLIKDYIKNDTDIKVDISINISRENLKKLEDDGESLTKIFGLETYLNMNNLILWDIDGRIRKYISPEEIMDEFYGFRLGYYQVRKDYLITKLEHEIKVIINKMKFINAILNDMLKVNNRKKEEIEADIVSMNIDEIDGSYSYLLNMSIVSLTSEKLHELKESFNKKKEEIKVISETSIQMMWLEDLKTLIKKLK